MSASESNVQARIRMHAALKGYKLFRNNSGAGKIDDGRFIRWGLCNESAALNKRFKSGDLIGWRPITITPEMVGRVVAQFVSIEVKSSDGYTDPERRVAQQAWADMVNAAGGHALITDDPAALDDAV